MTSHAIAGWLAWVLWVSACADQATLRTRQDAGDAGDARAAEPDATAVDHDAGMDCGARQHEAGSLDPDRTEILDLPAGENVVQQCSRWSPSPLGEFWTPTEPEVIALEAALATHLEQPCLPNYGIVLDEYYAQYIGIVFEGRTLIYVNLVHQSIVSAQTWAQRVPYHVCDGGELAWGILFDPSTGTFEAMSVNGYLQE